MWPAGEENEKKTVWAQCGCTFCPQPEHRAGTQHARHTVWAQRGWTFARSLRTERMPTHARYTVLAQRWAHVQYALYILRVKMHTLRTERKDQALTVSKTPKVFFHPTTTHNYGLLGEKSWFPPLQPEMVWWPRHFKGFFHPPPTHNRGIWRPLE